MEISFNNIFLTAAGGGVTGMGDCVCSFLQEVMMTATMMMIEEMPVRIV